MNRARIIFWTINLDDIPVEIRSIKNLDTFKTENRNWKPTNC